MVEFREPIDIAAISVRVLEALDPLDPALFVDEHGGGGHGNLPITGSLTLEELAALVQAIGRRLTLYLQRQRHLGEQLAEVKNQVHHLPGQILRMEANSAETVSKLERLDRISDDCQGNLGARMLSTTSDEDVQDTEREISSVGRLRGTQLFRERHWLTVREVAQRLSISESTVRRYIRQGVLPAARLPGGRSLRLNWHELQEQMEVISPEDPQRIALSRARLCEEPVPTASR